MMNNVKNIVVLLFLLLSRSYSITSNDPESPQLLHDICDSNQGRTSVCEVEIDVPEECASLPSGTSNCPIVFFFHGAGGTNNWFARTTGVHSQGFIGVYPQVSKLVLSPCNCNVFILIITIFQQIFYYL